MTELRSCMGSVWGLYVANFTLHAHEIDYVCREICMCIMGVQLPFRTETEWVRELNSQAVAY